MLHVYVKAQTLQHRHYAPSNFELREGQYCKENVNATTAAGSDS
jgi:hypothetical protein